MRRAALVREVSRSWLMAQPMTRLAKDIQNGDEVQPALSSEDAGDVSDPELGSASMHHQST